MEQNLTWKVLSEISQTEINWTKFNLMWTTTDWNLKEHCLLQPKQPKIKKSMVWQNWTEKWNTEWKHMHKCKKFDPYGFVRS